MALYYPYSQYVHILEPLFSNPDIGSRQLAQTTIPRLIISSNNDPQVNPRRKKMYAIRKWRLQREENQGYVCEREMELYTNQLNS